MMGRRKKQDKRVGDDSVKRALTSPYGLSEPVVVPTDAPEDRLKPGELRCPTCGRKIQVWWKWWDTFKSWYQDSYRLIRCRNCDTRFSAKRRLK